eukprot:TRINITY_DN1090_c0_g2_i2.p1 TRINITY_DN1090_c0_g2~~TRINITY_DN1090_c0_g2_i2.p1  ORF type:complete len:327 (-),score=85.10 TRINITY_DN1090_c0_g2_i2:1131-2039(-)
MSAAGAVHAERTQPVAVATWKFGLLAVNAAAPLLSSGGSALDAVEAGINTVELDTQEQYYVGLGGLPNAKGDMELDAAVMCGEHLTYGAVMALPGIARAVSAARLVMERSPHAILCGGGARDFALENGMALEGAMTEGAAAAYAEWQRSANSDGTAAAGPAPASNTSTGTAGKTASLEDDAPHDTIGMICLDVNGHLVAGTSTSGWPFKHPGRVGDSPVVGAGLYCDDDAGAAVATGDGEEILRTSAAFYAVELMRTGHTPQAACTKAVARIVQASAACSIAASPLRMDCPCKPHEYILLQI